MGRRDLYDQKRGTAKAAAPEWACKWEKSQRTKKKGQSSLGFCPQPPPWEWSGWGGHLVIEPFFPKWGGEGPVATSTRRILTEKLKGIISSSAPPTTSWSNSRTQRKGGRREEK